MNQEGLSGCDGAGEVKKEGGFKNLLIIWIWYGVNEREQLTMILIFSLTLAYKGPQGKEQVWDRRDVLRLTSVCIKKPLEYQLRVSEDLELVE